MDYCTIASIATAAVALIGLVAWVMYALRSKYDRRRSVGYIAWLAHVLIFGVACVRRLGASYSHRDPFSDPLLSTVVLVNPLPLVSFLAPLEQCSVSSGNF